MAQITKKTTKATKKSPKRISTNNWGGQLNYTIQNSCLIVKALEELTLKERAVWDYCQALDPFGDRYVRIGCYAWSESTAKRKDKVFVPIVNLPILRMGKKYFVRILNKLEKLGYLEVDKDSISVKIRNLHGYRNKSVALPIDQPPSEAVASYSAQFAPLLIEQSTSLPEETQESTNETQESTNETQESTMLIEQSTSKPETLTVQGSKSPSRNNQETLKNSSSRVLECNNLESTDALGASVDSRKNLRKSIFTTTIGGEHQGISNEDYLAQMAEIHAETQRFEMERQTAEYQAAAAQGKAKCREILEKFQRKQKPKPSFNPDFDPKKINKQDWEEMIRHQASSLKQELESKAEASPLDKLSKG